MDDLRDPREAVLSSDDNSYGELTDDGPELTSDQEREILEMAAKIERKKHKKTVQNGARSRSHNRLSKEVQVSRTPSPPLRRHRSPSPDQSAPPKRLKEEDVSISHLHKEPNTSSSTTSYFLENLESTRLKAKNTQVAHKKLMAARTYTFDNKPRDTFMMQCDEKDQVSGQQLSKRYFPNDDLKSMLAEVKVLRLNKLFAKITPPDYKEPEYCNWCAVGIVCEKTAPRLSNTSKGRNERYVILKLCDFKYSVDVYIWGSERIEKYNKIRIGDIICVLNPSVFIKHVNGLYSAGGVAGASATTFGLSIRHDDCILEIGTAKHFGYCKSLVKSTGVRCKNFLDTSKHIYCSYHNEAKINKAASGRMEFQGSYRLNAHVKNGVKQSMYLGKPDKSINKDNYQMEIVNDGNAPRIDYVSRQRKQFSSDDKHKAFFNDRVQIASADLKKKNDKKDRDGKKRDMELREKLSSTFKEGAKLKRMTPKEELGERNLKEQRDLLKAAFTPQMLANLGFDPSARSSERGVLSVGRSAKDEMMTELREITKNKKLDLSLDQEEIKKRREMRVKTTEMLKRIKGEDKRSAFESKRSLSTEKSVKHNTTAELNLSDSSDEELEIETNSFAMFKSSINNQ